MLRSHRRFLRARSSRQPVARAHVCERLESRTLPSLTVPALSSNPGSSQTLYLDFDGSDPFIWRKDGDSYQVRGPGLPLPATAPVPAYSFDGDANNFSAEELTTIRKTF